MIILIGYLQIAVGFVNVFGAIIRLIIPYTRNTHYKRDLVRYLLLVMGYFSIYFIGDIYLGNYIHEGIALMYLFVLPWFIAVYYLNIVYSSDKSNHVEES